MSVLITHYAALRVFHIVLQFSAPGTPSNSSGVALNSTHIFLTWDPPPLDQSHGDIQGYTITVVEIETGDILQYTSDTTELLAGPLHPYYIYNCNISAVTIEPGAPIIIVVRTQEAGMLFFIVWYFISVSMDFST